MNLINASVNHDVRHFVFTSSIAVYGAGQSPMTEDMTPRPEDSYGIAKLAVEQELKASHEMFGLDFRSFGRTTSMASVRTSAIAIATSSGSS